MSRRSGTDAAVVREYAARTKRALRTAQLHAKNQSAEWLAFLRERAAVGVAAGQAESAVDERAAAEFAAAVEAVAAMPTSDEARARAAEEESYRTLVLIQRLKDEAIQRKDIQLSAICRAELEAQKSWMSAKKAKDAALVAARRLLPAEDVAELRRKFVLPMRDLLANMPQELASRVSAFDSSEVIRAAEAWLSERFAPQLASLVTALDMSTGTPPSTDA